MDSLSGPTLSAFLSRAFGFEDVFLALVNREEVALDGTWTWKDGKELSSHRLRVPLLGDSGILAKSVWQHRPIAIQDPEAHPPFPGGTAREKIQRHRSDEPLLLTERNPDVPARFGELVHRLLAKKPEQRPTSADEVRHELLAWAP